MSEKKAKKTDQAIILGKNEDELHVLRVRNDGEGSTSVEVGRIKETDSLTPEEMKDREIIKLKKRKGTPFRDVEVLQEGTGHKGPARVATQAYRDGWDRIFGDDEVPENVTWH